MSGTEMRLLVTDVCYCGRVWAVGAVPSPVSLRACYAHARHELPDAPAPLVRSRARGRGNRDLGEVGPGEPVESTCRALRHLTTTERLSSGGGGWVFRLELRHGCSVRHVCDALRGEDSVGLREVALHLLEQPPCRARVGRAAWNAHAANCRYQSAHPAPPRPPLSAPVALARPWRTARGCRRAGTARSVPG
eukprot:3478309-Rhodomonas_salina.1